MMGAMDEPTRFKGRLLVAAPGLVDPNFARTVVLVLDHGDEGAFGVVLNRSTDVEVTDVLAGWAERATDPAVVFVGGPVQNEVAIGLARVGQGEDEGVTRLDCGLALVDLGRSPEDLEVPVERLRLFSGYSGWGPDQLEEEFAAGGWIVVDATDDDAFCPEPGDLWGDVLRRQGGQLAFLATFPPDPSMN